MPDGNDSRLEDFCPIERLGMLANQMLIVSVLIFHGTTAAHNLFTGKAKSEFS